MHPNPNILPSESALSNPPQLPCAFLSYGMKSGFLVTPSYEASPKLHSEMANVFDNLATTFFP